ncbi:hypothetical protein, partial [Bacillus pumilus]|uniref:hypothetical protein n=1 Tax=Bacillus pumilus TaxID=1408 RepID=UPI001C93069F
FFSFLTISHTKTYLIHTSSPSTLTTSFPFFHHINFSSTTTISSLKNPHDLIIISLFTRSFPQPNDLC